MQYIKCNELKVLFSDTVFPKIHTVSQLKASQCVFNLLA